MENGVELMKLVLSARIVGDFAGLWNAAAVEISHRGHDADGL